MKRIFQVLLIFLIFSNNARTQTNVQKWNLNFNVGKNDYIGSLSQSDKIFNTFFAITSIQYSRYIDSKFDLVINTNNGVWAYSTFKNDIYVTRGYREFSVSARYRFKRLDVSKISPFLSMGVGTRFFTSKIYNNENTLNDITIPVSAGFDIRLGKKTALRFESVFGFTNKNINDGNLSTENTVLGKDAYFQNNLGFVFYIDFKSKSSNVKEINPEIIKNKEKKYKIKKAKRDKSKIDDRDKDGILDFDDKCPDVKGVKKLNGCPENDDDGDGVTNENDNCPNIVGDSRFSGCLDSDNDGMSDFYDKCPNVKGSLTLSGCPDSDNDGISDPNDSCVFSPGTEELNGCPDRDNDGIGDKIDKCPDEYGLLELDGCPKAAFVPTKLRALLMASKKMIQFEDGITVLKPSSFSILNQIADELKVNTNLKIIIQCYTDNKGNEFKNLQLSIKRANEVALYFIRKGIDKNRVSSEGFAGLKPITENNSENGRAMNQRIELIIK